MMFMKDALNLVRHPRFGLHNASCGCSCPICHVASHPGICGSMQHTYTGVTAIWESLLCPKKQGVEYHSYPCLMGECKNCGVHKLQVCPREMAEDNILQVSVKVFQEVESGMDEDGKKKTIKDVVHKKMHCTELLCWFKDHIKQFIKHNFVYRWQAKQFKLCLGTFPDDVVVSVIDFAENYSFKEQHEIQSMHWYSNQVTILVHIIYCRSSGGEVLKTTHFYISDDKVHDTLFVQHCLLLNDAWLNDSGWRAKRHWVWSDGCAAQFKAKRPFYFVTRYFQLTGKEMCWNFFVSGHGKGEHDGAGAVIKRALTHEQLKVDGTPLKCAADVVYFLREKFNHSGKSRVFWDIKLGEVDRTCQWNCKPIHKTMSMHSVNGYSCTDTKALRYRMLSCFCDFCMQNQWRRCVNKEYVGQWAYESIVPAEDCEGGKDADDGDIIESQQFGPIYAGHHDDLPAALCEGDNFAVNAESNNAEGADFYILRCTTPKHYNARASKDAWGNTLDSATFVVTGHWYAKAGVDEYKLLDDQPPATLYSHLVRAIKFHLFPMEHNEKMFKMSPDVHEAIYNSMPLEM